VFLNSFILRANAISPVLAGGALILSLLTTLHRIRWGEDLEHLAINHASCLGEAPIRFERDDHTKDTVGRVDSV